MDNNLTISGCNVILKDKSIIISDSSKSGERIDKILMVDVSNNKEELKSISESDFRKLIEKYIKKNEFSGSKTINFSELLPYNYSNIFVYMIISVINRIFDDKSVIKKLENSKWINQIIATVAVLISLFFYNLGYAFLYGYYFGGDLNNSISFLEIYVNPVPFNFKSISFIGLGLLIYIIVIFLPLIKILRSKNKSKNIFNVCVFFYSIVVLIISSSCVFIGAFNKEVIITKMIYFIFLITVFPLTLFLLMLFVIFAFDYKLVFLSALAYTLLLVMFISYKFQIPHDYVQLVMFYSVYFIPLLFTQVLRGILFLIKWIKNEFIRLNIKYIVLFGSVAIIFSVRIKKMISIRFLSAYYPFVLICSCGILLVMIFIIKLAFNEVIKGLYFKTKTIINKIKENIVIRNNDKGAISNNDDVAKKRESAYLISTVICLSMIFVSAIVSHSIVEVGKMTRYSLTGLSKDKIVYEKADDKKQNQYIFGDIVAQKDNIYFISKLPERKLMTIKNTNVISLPCEDFLINTDLDKFYELENTIFDKYNKLNSYKNIKVTYTPTPSVVKNGQIEFCKNIYRKSNEMVNDNNYDFGISIKVNYEIKNDKIDNFSLVFRDKFPNNISDDEDKKLKQDMNLMLSDYKDAIIQYFNIPTLDIQNPKYYYNNGIIVFTSGIDASGNGGYEQAYTFSSVID